MQCHVAVNFFGMKPSPLLRYDIEEQVSGLPLPAPELQACLVAIQHDAPRSYRDRYRVHITVRLSGHMIDAAGGEEGRAGNDGLYDAVEDAFCALRGRLSMAGGCTVGTQVVPRPPAAAAEAVAAERTDGCCRIATPEGKSRRYPAPGEDR